VTWTDHGVDYVKLRIPGSEIDKRNDLEDLAQKFTTILRDFFTDNSGNGYFFS
jgi:hypothetical protein